MLPLEQMLEYVTSISKLGERAAGTPEEFAAATFVEEEFKKIGLENVHLEAFPVVSRDYVECRLDILEPQVPEANVSCANAGTSLSTPPEGLCNELVDAGYGTLGDFEAFENAKSRLDGRIALIERNDRLTYWPDVTCRLAAEYGISAVILTSSLPEHTAFRKDAFPFPTLPVVYVSYREAQRLRRMLRQGKVTVSLKNIVHTKENAVSHNVVAEIFGSEYPDEIIALTAHHDSWFEGANDNACGVALMLHCARVLMNSGTKSKRTIRFISFGAEESGSDNFFEWCVGSFHYVKTHREELKKIVVNLNVDDPAFGDDVEVRTTPEMAKFAQSALHDLRLDDTFRVIDMPTTATDHWSFVMAGVPSLNFTQLALARRSTILNMT